MRQAGDDRVKSRWTLRNGPRTAGSCCWPLQARTTPRRIQS